LGLEVPDLELKLMNVGLIPVHASNFSLQIAQKINKVIIVNVIVFYSDPKHISTFMARLQKEF